jgi:hypothetical protein
MRGTKGISDSSTKNKWVDDVRKGGEGLNIASQLLGTPFYLLDAVSSLFLTCTMPFKFPGGGLRAQDLGIASQSSTTAKTLQDPDVTDQLINICELLDEGI